tara:strand:+ start:321 stop:533 length:213 start_codon:yes stop_codon:yes gene_type:complete
MYAPFLKSTVPQVVGRQGLRNGISVDSSYREAFHTRSRAEFSAKMDDCFKEVEEIDYWIDLIIAEEIAPE